MTTRMFVKFLNCTKVLIIPEDKNGHSVIFLDTNNDIGTADRIRTIRAPIGIEIISEGDKADKVYLIIEGKVKVYKKDSSGVETELATIEKGNIIGEMALFDKGVRSASVKTIERSKFLIFDGDKFLEMSLG